VAEDGGHRPATVDAVQQALVEQQYLADRALATALFVSMELERPLLLEGDAGVGKTEAARSLAAALGAELVRLQCYEGIDASQALYDWDYARQLLHLRAAEARGGDLADVEDELYSERFLVERPLLRAIRRGRDAVLLIDEIDRADDEFEAFLLETLADAQVTIPEFGTVSATTAPIVVLTSNRTRELHEALRRRCVYHWIDHPSVEDEATIIRLRAPEVALPTARRVSDVVARLRELDLVKPPGVAESIDWARILTRLGADELTERAADDTLGTVVKEHDDLVLVRDRLADLL
jgi:MoxR-like ATPase